MCASVEEAGAEQKKLPYFTAEEVARHSSLKSGDRTVWVTYKAGVYDITSFVKNHPGGEQRIMLAAGSDIDHWWHIFNIHDDDAVRDILESYRIGNLKNYKPVKDVSADMWKKEPQRAPALQVLNSQPFNAQSPEGIMGEFVTPNHLFFVRNHMPVPDLRNRPDFCVQVEGDGIIPHCFTIPELRSTFSEHTIAATIQCGGNRRTEMAHHYSSDGKGIKGLAWEGRAIGNAYWTGVWLRDVLAACQATPPSNPDRYHVQFEGADQDAAGHFKVSIPYYMATSPESDVLLAFKMNGEDLPPDHGFPVRAVVPGVVGVRNCKWVQRVTVQPHQAQSVWQQNDYKNFPSWETKPDSTHPSVYYMPVQSALTEATYDSSADAISLRAYAFCGGGTPIQRVEVSYDGGNTFERSVPLLPIPSGPGSAQEGVAFPKRKAWAWRQAALTLPVDEIRAAPQETEVGQKFFKTCVRAITEDNEVQPPIASYNFRGLLYNGYSCRNVVVED